MLGEFGLVFAKGVSWPFAQPPRSLEDAENNLPALAREVLAGLLEQFHELDQRIQQYDGKIREPNRNRLLFIRF